MKTVISRLLLAVSFLAPLHASARSSQSATDQSPQTFRSSVDLVTIQASVRDKRGRPLKGLTTTDFEVRDNGEVRPVLSLRSDRKSPVSVAILVDMSGSMRIGSKIAMARQAFDSILAQLHAGDDEVAVLTFDSALHERQDFTRDLSALRCALSDFEPFGTTSIYDATAEAARRLSARSATHKAIIVLTDGVDTSSTMSATEVSGIASSISVPVFVVATVPSADQHARIDITDRGARSDSADLRDLAEWTGGQFVFARTFTETIIAASSLLDELRQQYVLAIEATGSREWRRLDIRVKHPSATVKARSGYYGG
jgi:Ca-activated chloride channel homolog